MGEFSTDDGADLRHIPGRTQPVEARHQRGMQCRRHGERRQRSVQLVAVAGLAQQPALEQRPGQLLDEQRHAVRVREDLFEDGVRHLLAFGNAADEGDAVAPAKAAQGQHRHVRLANPCRVELRPERDDQQHRQVGNACHHSIEQILRCRIDPMDVLEHDQHGPLRCAAVELV